MMEISVVELIRTFTAPGRIEWIGIRAGHREPVTSLKRARVLPTGIEGDHGSRAHSRAVTLIQFEHLSVIAALTGKAEVAPALLRRNLVVSGINLAALKSRSFKIGSAVLKGIDACDPCSRMEEALGPGGYNAMRGHGGLCAAIIETGEIAVGDPVTYIDE